MKTTTTTTTKSVLPWVAAGLALLGVAFLAVAAAGWRTSARLAADGRVADGEVVRLEEQPRRIGERGGPICYPWFRFTDQAGRTHEVKSGLGQSPPAYAVGDPVRVRYPPGQPDEAQLDTWAGLWLMPVGFGVIGSATALAGVIVYLVWRRAGPSTITPPSPRNLTAGRRRPS